MLLKPKPVSTRQFSYDAAAKSFSAEISGTHGLGQAYDDAADQGLTLVSHVTGQEVVFVVWADHRDADNDLLYWELKSVDGQYSMVLFND